MCFQLIVGRARHTVPLTDSRALRRVIFKA